MSRNPHFTFRCLLVAALLPGLAASAVARPLSILALPARAPESPGAGAAAEESLPRAPRRLAKADKNKAVKKSKRDQRAAAQKKRRRAKRNRSQTAAPRPPTKSLGQSLQGEALEAYELGRVLFEGGDFLGALERFNEAFGASGDPRLLWNMAACETELRHYTRTLDLMRRYLQTAKQFIDDAERSAVEEKMTFFESLVRKMPLSVVTEDALISLDGNTLGTGPLTTVLDVDMRKHVLRVEKTGFVTQIFNLGPQEDPPADIELQPETGRLRVEAEDEVATISINGEPQGQHIFEGPVPANGFTLTVSAPGMRTYQTDIVLRPGEVRMITVQLENTSTARYWFYLAGGALLLAAAGTAGYFIANPKVETPPLVMGTLGTVEVGAP